MKIIDLSTINFGRALKRKEEADYLKTLNLANEKLGANGKSILIVPVSALPQDANNNTGVGNIASEEAYKFFDFAKKYWGIKEIQILPIGQYHNHKGFYPFYSGTSLDLGNHVINIKDFISEEEFVEIVNSNNSSKTVNFSNVVDMNSKHEKALKNLHKNIPHNLLKDFENFKTNNRDWLDSKALYQALVQVNNDRNYNRWNELDKNLFNEDILFKVI